MKRIIGVAIMASMLGLLVFASSATATPGENHKTAICHVVNGNGSSGNEYNYIEVDLASVSGRAHYFHRANDGRRDIIPAKDERCGAPLPTTTTTEVPVTTTTEAPVTTTTEKPVTTTTEAPVTTTTEAEDTEKDGDVTEVKTSSVAIALIESQPAVPVVAEPQFTG